LSVNDRGLTPTGEPVIGPQLHAVFTVVAGGVPDAGLWLVQKRRAPEQCWERFRSLHPVIDTVKYFLQRLRRICCIRDQRDGGVVQSISATLAVGDPAILVQPQSVTANYGTTANFKVSAQGQTTLRLLMELE